MVNWPHHMGELNGEMVNRLDHMGETNRRDHMGEAKGEMVKGELA